MPLHKPGVRARVIRAMEPGRAVRERCVMRLSLGLAALICATSVAYAQMPRFHAQEPGAPSDVSIGGAVICDTSEQAQRYVRLRNSGNETVAALQLINTEANKATACGAAIVAFRRGETVGSERIAGERVNVVKIMVVAVNSGAGWSMVPETEQYAIIPPPGIEA
jgi:hypothetical protein